MFCTSLNAAAILPFALFAGAYYIVSRIRWQRRTRGRPLPPGPKSLPFFGNIAHMKNPETWRSHRELCNLYGDVVYVPVFGKDIVLLGSAEAITELLETRSALTSEREQSALFSLSGQSFNIALMPYGHVWRQHRRGFTQQFSASEASKEFQEIQSSHARLFLRKLLTEPGELRPSIRYTFAASIVKAVYGLEVAEKADKNVALMESLLEGVQVLTPGRFYVQYFPMFLNVPSWVPFFGWQVEQLAAWRETAGRVKKGLFSLAKQAVVRGDAPPSVVGNLLQEMEEDNEKDLEKLMEKEEIARNVAVNAFEGTVDTTYTTLQFFFLAMSLYPDVQHNAQRELDMVVGPDRLPTHADQAALPYVSAVVKEALRWQNALPNGLPHYTSEDLEYRGFFIPQGTALIPLTWACLHDPEVYVEPERFIPERFLRDGKIDPSVRDPFDYAFGYGRRKCPGIAFGAASLFINIAMTLHTFDITPPLDEHGNVITIEPKAVGYFLVHPEDCRCTLKPRSAQAEQLVLDSA